MADDDDKTDGEDAADEGGSAPASADDAAGADADEADRKEKAKARVIAEAEARAKAKSQPDGDGEEESTALAKKDDDERRDLPKWNRARVKRKAPAGEEKDAFQTTVRKAGRSAVSRAPALLALVALVAGGVGGYIWWRSKAAAELTEQTKLLSVAAGYQARGIVDPNAEALMADRARPLPALIATDDADLAQKIDGALTALESQAPDSPANAVGDLIRGSRHMRAGAFAEAEQAYGRFLEGRAQHDLAFLAQEGILLAREGAGDLDGALAEADVLAGEEPGAFYRDQALWHKARLLEAAGRVEDAKAVYRQYAEEFPLDAGSIAQTQVIERLRELDPDLVADLPPAPGVGLPGGLPPGVMVP